MKRRNITGTFARLASLALLASHCADATPFGIRVVDETTGRGVPLVELETVNHLRLLTDNAGWVAFDEPGLMDRDVFFFVRSHGYEFPKDGFGFAGKRFRTTPGGRAELKLKRLNIAERLYRVTGEGLYRDSVLLGEKTPLREPLLNAQVFGQDSVQAAVYRKKFTGSGATPTAPRTRSANSKPPAPPPTCPASRQASASTSPTSPTPTASAKKWCRSKKKAPSRLTACSPSPTKPDANASSRTTPA